jgi:hypothetical protein
MSHLNSWIGSIGIRFNEVESKRNLFKLVGNDSGYIQRDVGHTQRQAKEMKLDAGSKKESAYTTREKQWDAWRPRKTYGSGNTYSYRVSG